MKLLACTVTLYSFQSVLTYIILFSEQLNEELSQGQLPVLPRRKWKLREHRTIIVVPLFANTLMMKSEGIRLFLPLASARKAFGKKYQKY